MKHLTVTGMNAGMTLCGDERTGNDVHAAYAPIDHKSFREQVCPDCLLVWAMSYIDENGALEDLAPDWVHDLLTERGEI